MRDCTGILVERPASSLLLNDTRRFGLEDRRGAHQRRYAPKTRTGCVTCKIRRVKCDEEKPSCRRCSSTGRKCDGYSSPPERSSPGSETLSVALVNDISTDALERRMFDFFRTRTAPSVSGYYQDSVWDRIVLQLSHSEPAVRYAVNALGALHEERLLRRSAGQADGDASVIRTGFPVQQYSKALKEMQALMRSGSVPLDTVLLCALLCIHFESLRESFVPALLHAENAVHLLRTTTTFDARKVNPSLVRALMRVDLQGCFWLMMRVPGLPFYTAATDSILPNVFHDLTQARDLVNTWTSRIYHFMRTVSDDYKFMAPGNVPLEDYAKAQEYEEVMLQLDQLLWDLMHKPSLKLNLREQNGLAMLRARVKSNRILAACCCYGEAAVFDKYLDQFKEILTICLYIMSTDDIERRLFSVSFDDGIIHPLFYIATHCRDSRTRHTALDQLRALRAHYGVWHLDTSITIAQLCIDFEEQLCDKKHPTCEDIPEWRRIHSAGFVGWDIEGPRRTVIVYMRTRPNGMDGDWEAMTKVVECGGGIDPLLDLRRIFEAEESMIRQRFRTPETITWPRCL